MAGRKPSNSTHYVCAGRAFVCVGTDAFVRPADPERSEWEACQKNRPNLRVEIKPRSYKPQ